MTQRMDQLIDSLFDQSVPDRHRAFVAESRKIRDDLLKVLKSHLLATTRSAMVQYQMQAEFFNQLDYPVHQLPFEDTGTSPLPELVSFLLEAEELALLEKHQIRGELIRSLVTSSQHVLAAMIRQQRWGVAFDYVRKAEQENGRVKRVIGFDQEGVLTFDYKPQTDDDPKLAELLQFHLGNTVFQIGSRPTTAL